jgi:multidrug efflux pump subunit AcrA (membrane-fusion protein)
MNVYRFRRTHQSLAARLLPCSTVAALILASAFAVSGCSPSGDTLSGISPAAAQAKAAAPVAIARGKIDVEGGLLELSAATAGTVQQLPVKEGQSVPRGQLLLRVADDASRADLSVAESEWQLAQARQKARLARLPVLKQTLARWQAAAKEGAADAQNVDEAAQALRDAQSEIDVAAAEVVVAQRKVEQLRAQQKRFELHAPEAATVVRIATHAGANVQPGTPALVLLPKRPLIVRAELNESFANVVHEGMHATVVADSDGGTAAVSFPNATVLRVSPVYGTARLQDDAQRGPIRVIECVLSFDQAPAQAKVGQNVRVSFHE